MFVTLDIETLTATIAGGVMVGSAITLGEMNRTASVDDDLLSLPFNAKALKASNSMIAMINEELFLFKLITPFFHLGISNLCCPCPFSFYCFYSNFFLMIKLMENNSS
jgi:hypothetical protein